MDCDLANPDITGIGVRIAIYAQNLFSFVPAAFVLRDGKVTYHELQTIEQQSSTILITAFALLFSAIIQGCTHVLLNIHASIILNLSWMNNTNFFIYFLVYFYHRVELQERNQDRWNLRREVSKALKDRVFWIGISHFLLMGGFGIWLWSHPDTFGGSDDCYATNNFQSPPSVFILGQKVSLVSKPLQHFSLLIYGFLLTPIINVSALAVLFLTPLLYHYRQIHKQSATSEKHLRRIRRLLILPLFILLIVINVVFLVDTELALKENKVGDNTWTFGQTLALLLLLVPVRDFLDTLAKRREKRQETMREFISSSKEGKEASVKELLDEQPDDQTKGKNDLHIYKENKLDPFR
jgi:hypothetical protein